jgi:choline dehydrogenase
VLLIDAGNDQGNSFQYQVPALQLQSTEFESMRWDYYVNHYSDPERQKQDSKMSYRTSSGDIYTGLDPPANATPLGVLYPRAGTLGGCSAHNALITIYPHDSDWQNIASITGDDSWTPDKMRGYFKKLERNRYLPSSIIGHGFSGWLPTSLTDLSLVIEDQKLLSLIIAAGTAMGKSLLGLTLSTVGGLAQVLLRDLNAPRQASKTGLYQVPLAMQDSTRHGSREFVLDTANAVNKDGSRKYHLDIKLNTLVTKVIFSQNETTPRATGVRFLEGHSLYRADPRSESGSATAYGTVNALREVILSAGAFNSPRNYIFDTETLLSKHGC